MPVKSDRPLPKECLLEAMRQINRQRVKLPVKRGDVVTVSYTHLDVYKRQSLYDESFLDKKDKYSYFLGGNHRIYEIDTSVKNGRTLLVLQDSYAQMCIRDRPCIVEGVYQRYGLGRRAGGV